MGEPTRDGVKQLEADRAKISKQLARLEKDGLTVVDRLADPKLKGVGAIADRLTMLEKEQQSLKSRITELTLQIRDRSDNDMPVA